MAASVRIEDEAFSDVRYVELAEYAGLADADHARAKMEHLWRQCTLETCHVLPGSAVRHYLGKNGVDAIVRARLGVALAGDMVRIRGTKGRVEWLKKLRENGKKGGRPQRVRAKPSGYRIGSPSGSAELNPPTSAPTSAPTKREERASPPAQPDLLGLMDKVDAAVGDIGAHRAKPVRDRAEARIAVHQPAVHAFHAYFVAANAGAGPTWDDKHIAMVKGIVAKHTCAEVVRRIGILRHSPPKFPSQPWDLGTFVSNFDKCASAPSDQQSASAPRRSVEL